jgi:hypothetical protein
MIKERGSHRIWAYLSFIQHRSLEILCNIDGTIMLILMNLTPYFSFKGYILACWRSFEMNQQQTYRGSSFYVGWMRGTLIYKNSISPMTSYITLLKLLAWSFSKRSKLMLSFNKICILVAWFLGLVVSVKRTYLKNHTTLMLAQTLPPLTGWLTRENPT